MAQEDPQNAIADEVQREAADIAKTAAEAQQDQTIQTEFAELSPEAQMAVDAANLVKKINSDPACLAAVSALLGECDPDRKEEVSLIETVEDQLRASNKMPIQPVSSVIEMLVRDGALTEQLEVDGVPYDGTLEDAFEDESITEESESLIYEQTTDLGRLVSSMISPQARTAQLFEDEPDLKEGFLTVLSECDCEGGKSTKELEAALDARGLMCRDERTNIPTLYPSLFANMLMDAGCIEWHHAWVTTDIGRQARTQFDSCGLAR